MKTLITLVAVLATACVADAETPTDDLEVTGESDVVARETKADYDDAFCEQLPEFGICSLACTPEKLVAMYVPQGTCAIFECSLTDGTTFKTGGCND